MNILVNKKKEVLLIALIVSFPWVYLVFQGLYIPELGFWLVAYENFFISPELSQPTFNCWLTVLIGSVVNVLFGSLGIIGFKIANVIVIYLTLFTVYKFLFKLISKMHLLFFLFIAEIFINMSTYDFINYYSLTTLFFIFSALLLYNGLTENKPFLLFISGFVLGLNIFIRLPNLLGISMILVIVYYNYGIEKKSFFDNLKKSGLLILGYLFAISTILLFMKSIGHYELYINSILELLNLAQGNRIVNCFPNLLDNFIDGQKNAFITGTYLLGLLTVLLISSKYWTQYRMISLLLTVCLLLLLMHVSWKETSNSYWPYSGMVGTIYILLLWIAFSKVKVNTNLGLISLMSFIIIEVIPLGSMTRLLHSIYGMYLAIPIIYIYLFDLESMNFRYIKIVKNNFRHLAILIGIVIIIYSQIVTNFYQMSGGETSRWKMFSSVDHPYLKGNFMTFNKAKTLKGVIDAMDKYSKDFSYILVYGEISTISYLSSLKPYLKYTYPLFVSVEKLKKELELESKRKTLPMVVRAKTYATVMGWPENSIKVNQNEPRKKVIQIFLKKNNYESVWENNDFEILVPSIILRK